MSNYCPHCGQSMKKEAAPKKKAAPRKTAPKKAGINWPGLLLVVGIFIWVWSQSGGAQ